jgi:hypothetical protein
MSKPKVFRYPLGLIDQNTDYVKIDAYEYKPPGVGQLGADNFSIPTSDRNYQSLSRKKVIGTLLLPMPQSLPTNSQSAGWGQGQLSGLTAAGIGAAQQVIGSKEPVPSFFNQVGSLVNKITSSAQTGLGQRAIQNFFTTTAVQQLLGQSQNQDLFGEVLARQSGAVINENIELLFRGVNLREGFSLAFDLAPRDANEARVIREMVYFLKSEMSPKKGTASGAAGGLFLTAPSVFKVQYMSGGNPHPYLNRFKICALQGLGLNFTGSGTYATYSDGTPVNMNLSLNFQELTPIYFEDYESAEGQTGVGY